jgi:pimeloyl-ACP methyl ester carboxylesterase
MNCELVHVTTADGLRLDGLLFCPIAAARSLPADAALLMHGTGSHFTAGGVLERFAHQAVETGLAVLRLNSRGHDLACSIPAVKGSLRGGAAYEHVEDAPYDVAAGVALLNSRGFERVLLVGHSMGGVKCLLAMASPLFSGDLGQKVIGVIGISPPRFCHENLRSGPGGEDFRQAFERATSLTAAGQGDALLEVTQPLPLLITAAGFLRKYGPADPFDSVRILPSVTCPVLVLVGTKSLETSAAFQGLPEALAALRRPNLTVQTIAGPNITYAGCLEAPFERTRNWLSSE